MEHIDICYGCMEPIAADAEVCPNCGYHMNAPHLPSYLAPGTILNERYMIGKLRSYNGESASYAAYDTITASKVIIKEYMPDSLCSREKGSPLIKVNQNCVAQYKTLLSEFLELNKTLSKMRTLNHINATTDMFGDNNTAYAVFGWLDGHTLGEYLKMNSGTLSWEEVKKLFPPIFTTISLVHNAGLVHRGISPESIIINDNGELKITGFCIADERTANTELVPEIYNGYAAPEQYNSSSWQGTWTDVYGISALLYRILTGVVPLDAMSRISNDDLVEPISINHNIPKNISKVIMHGLALNGESRIQTITELVTQLFEQPEYGSARLSSSSTQTITIPRQTPNHGSNSNSRKKKKSAPSRHGVFILVIATILIIGMFFLVMLLILSLDDTSGSYNMPPSISSITESSVFTESPAETTSTAETSEPPPDVTSSSSAQNNAMVYVMNDLTGKVYEIISKSDTYSNLVFTPEYEYNDEYPKGQIFEQSIEKNETYEDGAAIAVKVSMGPRYVVIPDYIALSKKDYFAKLNNLGIKYEEQEKLTEDVLEGYVYGTSKEPGETLDAEEGETLIVYVAKNPPKTETEPVTEPEPPFIVTEDPFPDFTEPPYVTEEPDIIITIFD